VGYDTFISYSTRNAREAGLLHRALTDAGLTAFLATEQLQAGAGWAGELVEAIRTSKTMLLLFSRHSNDSPQVLREVQAAVKYRVPLIPVRIDGSEPTPATWSTSSAPHTGTTRQSRRSKTASAMSLSAPATC
jgi:hypothetical protein